MAFVGPSFPPPTRPCRCGSALVARAPSWRPHFRRVSRQIPPCLPPFVPQARSSAVPPPSTGESPSPCPRPEFPACPVDCAVPVTSVSQLRAYTTPPAPAAGSTLTLSTSPATGAPVARAAPRLVVVEVSARGSSLSSALVAPRSRSACRWYGPGEVAWLLVDVGRRAPPELVAEARAVLGVRTLPTFILFVGGRRVDHFGAREGGALSQAIEDYLGGGWGRGFAEGWVEGG